MSTTTSTFNPRAASLAARTAADMRLGKVEDQLRDEHELAVALAEEYALLLAEGGDPWRYPQADERTGSQNHGLARAAREAVFDAWNETRERKSLTYPWGGYGNSSYRWQVHERLLNELGEAIGYADLAMVGGGRKATSKEVQQAVWMLQVQSMGAVRVRKTKLAGKTAYLARTPAPGDDTTTDDAYLKGYRDDQRPGVYSEHVPWNFPEEAI